MSETISTYHLDDPFHAHPMDREHFYKEQVEAFKIDNFIDKEKISIAKNISMFLGLYSGAIKPVDREVSGILYYEWDMLKDEMKNMPQLFTPDLHLMMRKYESNIKRVLSYLD